VGLINVGGCGEGKFSSGAMGGKLSQRVEHFESEVDKHDGRREFIHLYDKYCYGIISKYLSNNRKPYEGTYKVLQNYS
jgi:hypothetical protein